MYSSDIQDEIGSVRVIHEQVCIPIHNRSPDGEAGGWRASSMTEYMHSKKIITL